MTNQERHRKEITVNTGKDYLNFALHGIGYAGLLAGVTFVAASPVISGIALATTLALHFGLGTAVKNLFRDALPEDEKTLSEKFNHESFRSPDIKEKVRNALSRMAEFSEKLGLTEEPSFHFLDDESNSRSALLRRRERRLGTGGWKENIRDGLRDFLTGEFNKYANAFAFSHDKSSVALTEALAEKLDQNEINAVTGHEVGHIAARHTLKKGILSLMGTPAKITAGIFSLLVTFASWKNVGLVIGGNVAGALLSNGYAFMRGLDTDDGGKGQREFKRAQKLMQKFCKIGLGVLFVAPDLVLAQGLSLVTQEGATLLGKSYSRANEYQADRLAAEVTGDPMALASGLDKAREHNLSFERGMSWSPQDDREGGVLSKVFTKAKELYSTHPTNENRRIEMEKMALAMPPSGP